ncbi:MAG: hypothetical protein LBM67_07605 [Lentimicrobiaceae bacterium]|nr:hypothetical protein [Lentimicrobiaceae bacterium]
MKNTQNTIEKLTENLKHYNYRFHVKKVYGNPDEKIINVYFLFFCFLKIQFPKGKIVMQSRIFYGFGGSLELNFLVYCILALSSVALFWNKIELYVYIFLFLLLLHQIVCFIKLEALKTIIIRWLDQIEFECLVLK